MKGFLSVIGSSLLAASAVSALPSGPARFSIDPVKRQEQASSCVPEPKPAADDKNAPRRDDIFADRVWVGNPEKGGGIKCVSKWKTGVLPQKLEARADENMLRWIKVTYTDGSVEEHGGRVELDWHERGGELEWNPYLDSWAKFELAGHGWDGGAGRLVAEVAGKSVDIGAYDKPDLKTVPTGNAGVLLGFEISAGDGIDWISPIFSKAAIEEVHLLDNTLDPSIAVLSNMTMGENGMEARTSYRSYTNEKDQPGELTVTVTSSAQKMTKISETKEVGSSIAHTFGLSLKGTMSFSSPGPKVAGGEAGIELSYSYSDTRNEATITGEESGETFTETVSAAYKAIVPPHTTTVCTMNWVQSKVDLGFTATLQYIFANGDRYEYDVSGRYQNSAYDKGKGGCRDLAPGESVDDAEEGSGEIVEGGRDGTAELADGFGTYCGNGEKISDQALEPEEAEAQCAGK